MRRCTVRSQRGWSTETNTVVVKHKGYVRLHAYQRFRGSEWYSVYCGSLTPGQARKLGRALEEMGEEC